jgi:hypothetical protein
VAFRVVFAAGFATSLAGRVALLVLLPFSLAEGQGKADHPGLDAVLFRGGFPAVVARDLPPAPWYSSYIATYVERDVRQILAVRNLVQFQSFLKPRHQRTPPLDRPGHGSSMTSLARWESRLERPHRCPNDGDHLRPRRAPKAAPGRSTPKARLAREDV